MTGLLRRNETGSEQTIEDDPAYKCLAAEAGRFKTEDSSDDDTMTKSKALNATLVREILEL